MDVKKRRLKVLIILMHSCQRAKSEVKMNTNIDKQIIVSETTFTQSSLKGSEFVTLWMNAVRGAFRPRCDLNHLNRHLRRDAGIDELQLEQITIARAPLIRL